MHSVAHPFLSFPLLSLWRQWQVSIMQSRRSPFMPADNKTPSTWEEQESLHTLQTLERRTCLQNSKLPKLNSKGIWMWLFTHYSANGLHWGFTVQRANGGQVGPTHAAFCEPVLCSDQHRAVLLLNHCACPEQTRLLQARPNLLLTPHSTSPAEFCICGFSPAVALVARLILNTAVASLPLGTHTQMYMSPKSVRAHTRFNIITSIRIRKEQKLTTVGEL